MNKIPIVTDEQGGYSLPIFPSDRPLLNKLQKISHRSPSLRFDADFLLSSLMMKLLYETHLDLLPWTFMSRHVHQACADGRTDDLQSMFEEGADLNEADDMGNTPLWLAYLGGHLDTVFALLEHQVDINRRTGPVFASDFHRACGWADEVFIDILWNYQANLHLCDRFGKTPLIYAIEYRTPKIEDDLVTFLLGQGANVNHVDMSGLTPLFYAIYRGQPSIVRLLLQHQADYQYENILGYSPLRYALGCLSYAYPPDPERLEIVGILLDQYRLNIDELQRAMIGSTASLPLLFPLFDLIFYSRMIKGREFYEEIAWRTFEETSWPFERRSAHLFLAQNILLFNPNFEHFVYFLQRMFIDHYHPLILFYLQRMIKEKQSNQRFFLLLYCAYLEMNGDFPSMIRSLLETQRIYLFKSRRETLKTLLSLCHQSPLRLGHLCRRLIRSSIHSSIDRRLHQLHFFPSNLHSFLLFDELPSLIKSSDPLHLFHLVKQSMSICSSSTVFSSSSNLSTKSESFDLCP